ncbi:hypothetical protein MN032_17235 [Agromyces atrinae]|uniref:hypothetical protein n=1 Tax=Agromyces atrinae TaxID=592376 RepID=UPI001F5A54C1|nr:hypothetical protein [Agromyces atrinae]MCI2959431.1 hypothetical protein [Agromyces atrinae]
MSTDTTRSGDPAEATNDVDTATTGRTRRRVITIAALGLAIVLAAGTITWWSVARSDAHAKADALVTRVIDAEADAQRATADAAEVSATLVALNDSAVTRVLTLADASPDLLSPEIVTALREVSTVVTGDGNSDSDIETASAPGSVEVRADFARSADELTDTVQWGDADAVEAEADAEIQRLAAAGASAEAHTAEVTALVDQVVASLELIATDTGDRAAATHDRLEHAGDYRAQLTEHSAALRELAASATGSTAATEWVPLVDRLEAYAATVPAAQATHDQRVAEIEAERQAEIARQEEAARENSGGGDSGGGGGGDGGGGGGGGDWCPEVNWTGYIILVPC